MTIPSTNHSSDDWFLPIWVPESCGELSVWHCGWWFKEPSFLTPAPFFFYSLFLSWRTCGWFLWVVPWQRLKIQLTQYALLIVLVMNSKSCASNYYYYFLNQLKSSCKTCFWMQLPCLPHWNAREFQSCLRWRNTAHISHVTANAAICTPLCTCSQQPQQNCPNPAAQAHRLIPDWRVSKAQPCCLHGLPSPVQSGDYFHHELSLEIVRLKRSSRPQSIHSVHLHSNYVLNPP